MVKKLDEKAHDRLIHAAQEGDALAIERELARGVVVQHIYSQALRQAALHGHFDCLKILLPASDPQAEKSFALRWAAFHGHVESVRLLLPLSDPKALDSQALSWAASAGHLECVNILLPLSKPKAKKSQALLWAARHGHFECAASLLPHSDLHANGPNGLAATFAAREAGHFDLAAMIDAFAEARDLALSLPARASKRSLAPL
jgi:ankyrin repeat protein